MPEEAGKDRALGSNRHKRGEVIGPEENRMPLESNKGFLPVRERGGGFGGTTGPRTIDQIESHARNRLLALEQRFSQPHDDDPAVEELRTEIETEMTERVGNETELRKLRALQTEIETKIGCLQIFLGPWYEIAIDKGATVFKDQAGKVDGKNIFSLLIDQNIAQAFGQLIELGCQKDGRGINRMGSMNWDVVKEGLRQAAQRGRWSKDKESALMYAYMLFEISGLHAEASSESLPEGNKNFPGWPDTDYAYTLKGTANVPAWFYWQNPEDRTGIDYHQRKARQYRARGVDPVDPVAALSSSNRQKVNQGLSMKTGEEATHGDIYYGLGNYFQFGVDWDIQPESVRRRIRANQQRLRRIHQDNPNMPRGLEELRGIDWAQMDLSPTKALENDYQSHEAFLRHISQAGAIKNRYELYMILRWTAEATELFIGNQYKTTQENIQNGANLAAVYQAFKEEKAFRDLFDAERGLYEVAAWQSEALWTYNMPYLLSGGAIRNYEFGQMVNQFCNQGGDADKWLELYGRHFGVSELEAEPISPWQAAFMLLRIYHSHGREPIVADGQPFWADEILNKAAEKWGWQQYASASGNRGQTFIQYLTELESVARAYDNNEQKITNLNPAQLADLDRRATRLGVTRTMLKWDISKIERDKGELFSPADYRMRFLLNTFSERLISNYGQWLYQYWEEPIKLAIGYHEAGENEIYWKHRELEQVWASLTTNLRKFSSDGLGDRMLELILGPRLVTPKEQEPIMTGGEEFHHQYKPPEEETERNMMFWMEGFWTRRIEYLMVLMSEEFSLRETAYHLDPETAERMSPFLAIPSVEDRFTAIDKIMVLAQKEGARFFSPEERERYMIRFHCTLWDNIRHRALRRALGIKEPIGTKEEHGDDAEKKTKGFFSQLGAIGQIAAILPYPKTLAEFFVTEGLYGISRAALAVINSWTGNYLSMTPWLGLGYRVPLLFGISLPLEFSWPFYTSLLIARFPVMTAIKWLLTRLGNIPGLRKIIGVKESRVNVMQRLQTVHTVMGG